MCSALLHGALLALLGRACGRRAEPPAATSVPVALLVTSPPPSPPPSVARPPPTSPRGVTAARAQVGGARPGGSAPATGARTIASMPAPTLLSMRGPGTLEVAAPVAEVAPAPSPEPASILPSPTAVAARLVGPAAPGLAALPDGALSRTPGPAEGAPGTAASSGASVEILPGAGAARARVVAWARDPYAFNRALDHRDPNDPDPSIEPGIFGVRPAGEDPEPEDHLMIMPLLSGTFDLLSGGPARPRRARADRPAHPEVERAHARRLALEALPARLEELWGDERLDAAERRRLIYAMWAECAAANDDDPELVEAGTAARAIITRFVRTRLPAGGPDAYTPEDLAGLNAGRAGSPFAPYDR